MEQPSETPDLTTDLTADRFSQFEMFRGVTAARIISRGLVHYSVGPESRPAQLTFSRLFHRLGERDASVCLIKIHGERWHFSALPQFVRSVEATLADLGVTPEALADCDLLALEAADMRLVPGVMAQIVQTLDDAAITPLEVDDTYNAVMCLVPGDQAEPACELLARHFRVPPAEELEKARREQVLRVKEAAAGAPPVVVLKFGGTSVDNPEVQGLAAQHVQSAHGENLRPVVVVSAMGRRPNPYSTDELRDLVLTDGASSLDVRNLDLLMACGEIISAAVMAHKIALWTGLKTKALTGGQAGIITDSTFGSARIRRVDTKELLECVSAGVVPVVAGFQGVTVRSDGRHGDIVTLGRGASDTTAAALGAALQAQEVRVFTDVRGVMSADPKIVPDAVTIDSITHAEISEMAHLGARVLHPRAVEIAMEYGTPLRVLKLGDPDDSGTRVLPKPQRALARFHGVTGIAHSGSVYPVTIEVPDPEDKIHIAPEIYRLVGEARVSLYLVSEDPNTIFFVVHAHNLPTVKKALGGAVVAAEGPGRSGHRYVLQVEGQADSAAGQAAPLKVHVGTESVIVSAIGRAMRHIPGMMGRVAMALDQAGIKLMQVGGSSFSICCLIDERSTEAAVALLHQAFRLHES